MRSFLRGFAEELIKIAEGDPFANLPRPPSTATGNERLAPPPQTRPSSDLLRSIPVQRMEWSGKPKRDLWRPSPGFRLEKAKPAEATPPAKPTQKKAPAKPLNVKPAFETVRDTVRRIAQERAYNQGRANAGREDFHANAPPADPKSIWSKNNPHPVPMSKERAAYYAGDPPASASWMRPGEGSARRRSNRVTELARIEREDKINLERQIKKDNNAFLPSVGNKL